MSVLMTPELDTRLYTFREAMDWLHCSRSTLYRLMRSGNLTGHKVGSTWRFLEGALRGVPKEAPYEPKQAS